MDNPAPEPIVSELRALIFDVDGTLADTERDGHRVAFNAAFREAGLDWDWDEALYGRLLAVTGGKERIRHYLDHYNTAFERPAALDEFIAGLHKAKTRHYLDMLKDGAIPLRPGVARLLAEARAAGLTLAIATTTTPANVVYLLESTLGRESVEWFSVIAAGDVVPAKKPAADIFEYALRHLGLPAEACLAFEDSANGVRSSVGAGLRTIVTVNGYTRDEDFTGALLVLDKFGEPGSPCTVLAGPAVEGGYLTVEQMKQWG
ncbi:HAD-superfamily hydrolase, subfamily IA, variant 3 [Thioalkalivibrio sulfidiphilus HL-EbGr7]|uniref:HAD-superfamily hydrolase, subfamily IA, variant 3 n=1 Tax=Thioalkalivibrio sulfidiphilus (strain HL-EbGR7) TaxID=396588 RepID=B8GP31_THISH|nr:HAD-superfamily hydrolase, subfamily IA, variant 3 [Thioalkalivibrio sulfidiphilus HL-EbGr7]